MDEETGFCFNKCNELYSVPLDPNRSYCKKGCKSDFEMEECRNKTCSKLCIKEELGSDDSKWGDWSKVLSRAPADSTACLEACYFGCVHKLSNGDQN